MICATPVQMGYLYYDGSAHAERELLTDHFYCAHLQRRLRLEVEHLSSQLKCALIHFESFENIPPSAAEVFMRVEMEV